uniref:Uncharacterized protein n=1 Tax=Arundo donax TaxID=35708 RepID=A0A0A8YR12_ARUDO
MDEYFSHDIFLHISYFFPFTALQYPLSIPQRIFGSSVYGANIWLVSHDGLEKKN